MKPMSQTEAAAVLKFTPDVINWVIAGARKATKYVSPTLTVKATRQYKLDRRDSRETFVVSIGRPNYKETQFIKQCKAAGEKFPVKNIQLKWYPDNAR